MPIKRNSSMKNVLLVGIKYLTGGFKSSLILLILKERSSINIFEMRFSVFLMPILLLLCWSCSQLQLVAGTKKSGGGYGGKSTGGGGKKCG